jgi:hypothetical protein
MINRKRRVAEAKARGKERWRGKLAERTGGDTRLHTVAADAGNVAFLHG